MKKIVALVLSLVMVLGLATTAFGAITLWSPNGSTVDCDVFEAAYNTKTNVTDIPVQVTYDPGQALKFNADGTVKQMGIIPHYTLSFNFLYTGTGDINEILADMCEAIGAVPATVVLEQTAAGYSVTVPTSAPYVQVASIPVDADADDYILVKAHNAKALQGEKAVFGQTAKDAYVILKAVDAITYETKAEAFTAWSDDCLAYAEPLDADDVDYYTVANKTDVITNLFVKYAAADVASDADASVNALVGGEVVTLTNVVVEATSHAWLASDWDEDKVITEYTCVECKTVGKVVNSPLNAPAGAMLDNFMGTLIAYNLPVVEAPTVDGEKVNSADTFDAGIAMYVGMSVMAAAGSAVVLKKKD